MDFEALISALRAASEVQQIDGSSFVVVPEGCAIRSLEHLQAVPARARAKIEAHDPATFVAYFNRHKSAAGVIFAAVKGGQIVGVLDHHPPFQGDDDPDQISAGHREHIVTYTAPRSPEWETWTALHGVIVPQAAFAQFLEDNVVDIREPSGADMLEVARRFEAKQKVEFQSAVRLDSGAREFLYQETIDGSAAKGAIKVPERFKIGIPVYEGGEPWEVEARLRWRIQNQQLVIGYELYRHAQVQREAFKAITALIQEQTATPVWSGVAG